MKITKNIENYVQTRVNEFVAAIRIAEEKLEIDSREKIQDYEDILNKALNIELPKLIDNLCKTHSIDTEIYRIDVRHYSASVCLKHNAYAERRIVYESLHAKILVKLEMEKSFNMETIDYIINSVLYPEPEAKDIVKGGVEDEFSTVSDNCEDNQ